MSPPTTVSDVSPPTTVGDAGRLDTAAGIAALGLSGIAAYAYLVVAGRALGAAGFASIGVAWAAVFFATAAFATPLEVGMARAVGAARGRGDAIGPIVRAGLAIAGITALVAVGAGLIAGHRLDDAVFGGEAWVALAGAVAFAGLAIGAVAKGACAGAGRLAGWGGYLLADGGTRIGLAVVAAAVAPSPQAFALALAVSPWVALAAPAVPLARIRGFAAAADSSGGVRRLAGSIAPLVVAAAAAAALIYLGAVLLPFLARTPDAQVGSFVAALALARLPLFLLSPLVAIAVPRIASAISRGEVADARQVATGLVAIAAVGGIVVAATIVVAGGGSLASALGQGFALPDRSLWAVAISAACWLFATAAASVAIAFGRGRLAAAAWCAGVAVAGIAAIVAGPDAFDRTRAAMVCGAVTASLAAMAAALVAMRAGSQADRHVVHSIG